MQDGQVITIPQDFNNTEVKVLKIRKEKKSYGVSNETLMQIWQDPTTVTVEDVAHKTGMPIPLIAVRICHLRKRFGNVLRKLERRNRKNSVAVGLKEVSNEPNATTEKSTNIGLVNGNYIPTEKEPELVTV